MEFKRNIKTTNTKRRSYKRGGENTFIFIFKKAREKGTRTSVEQNILLANFLTQKGYDAIIYNNRGEAGGTAYIMWDKNKKEINSD